MMRILFGLVLIILNFKIGGINYMPHWAGYILVIWGLSQRADSPGRGPAMAVAAASAAASGALWAVGLFGYGMAFPLDELLQLLITYRLLVWCEELEELGESYLLGRLRTGWYALVGARAAAIVLGAVMPPLGWAWSAAAFAAAVFYAYTYYRLQAAVGR